MTDCAAPRHDQPHPAAPHAHLCRPCLARLGRDLRALAAVHALLGELLDPRSTGPGTGSGDGLPYHEPAAECRSQILHDLRYWTRQVITERQPDAWPVRTVPAMCGWLAGWMPWPAYRPWAGDMAAALADCRARAISILDPHPRADIPLPPHLNWCPECGATRTMTAAIYRAAGDKRESAVWCGACQHAWNSPQWLHLGRIILRHAQERAA